MSQSAAERLALAPPRPAPITSRFEFWPSWLFHFPAFLQWMALGLRYGDLTLPTLANPLIETGGMCGESKAGILDQMQGPVRQQLAPYVIVAAAQDRAATLATAEAACAAAGLAWPLVAKPDLGCNGTGVRVVKDQAALAAYIADFPVGAKLMLQHLVTEPAEAGLFYVRAPGEAHGRITSITLKASPTVIGDGRRTLHELILADPRAGRVPHLYLPRLEGRLETIPALGESVPLVFVGNHCKGALFRDGTGERTKALDEAVERIARSLPEFHFGRLDVRFGNLAALRRGDFTIIEVNGVGAEATHIWDPACRLREALASQAWHWTMAFRIARANRARGFRSAGFKDLFRHWHLQHRLLKSYPAND
jgi:hypothetical protein